MMEVLAGATGINIEQSHFSNVGRDQYNYTTHQTIIQNGGKEKRLSRNPPELSQFTEVKWGDIYKGKDVCYSWQLRSNGKDDTEAAVYHAEINIVGSFGQKKYTVKTYYGRNGRKEWQRDLQRCSRDWHGDVPLFGYNKSSVPSLIFYGELIPIAYVEKHVGLVGQMYFVLLKNAMGCSRNELWMDPRKGNFCRGPVGPECDKWVDDPGGIAVPSDVEFLKADVVIRYLCSKQHDQGLIWALSYSSQVELLKERPSSYYPHVISSTTNSMVAFNPTVLWWNREGCLLFAGTMADSSTRFLLTHHGRRIQAKSLGETSSWLSQALKIFHAYNVQFDELANFKLIDPLFELKGTLQKSSRKRQRRQLGKPIFLFVLCSPSLDTDFYFWSHDPSGQIPLSPEMCRYLGLPINLSVSLVCYQSSWSTKLYKALHDYQVVRRFDPTTTDFARSFGFSHFETVFSENSFYRGEEAIGTSDSYQNNEDDGPSSQPMQRATGSSLLNTLSGWFALDVVEDLGISAAAI